MSTIALTRRSSTLYCRHDLFAVVGWNALRDYQVTCWVLCINNLFEGSLYKHKNWQNLYQLLWKRYHNNFLSAYTILCKESIVTRLAHWQIILKAIEMFCLFLKIFLENVFFCDRLENKTKQRKSMFSFNFADDYLK